MYFVYFAKFYKEKMQIKMLQSKRVVNRKAWLGKYTNHSGKQCILVWG